MVNEQVNEPPCAVGGVVFERHSFPWYWTARDDGLLEMKCWRCGYTVTRFPNEDEEHDLQEGKY